MKMIRSSLRWVLTIGLALHATALIHSPPRIIHQPPPDEFLFQVVRSTSEFDIPIILECEAEGEPPPIYRWIKDGKALAWEAYKRRPTHLQVYGFEERQPGRGTFAILNPRDEDRGQYQCFAENEHGTATSNSVFVRPTDLDLFKNEPPKQLVATEGQPYKLHCQAPDGYPKPLAEWVIQYKTGFIVWIDNPRITLDPEGNLWFSNVTRNDASVDKQYVCMVTSSSLPGYKIGNHVQLQVEVGTGIVPGPNRLVPERQYVTREHEVALRGKNVKIYCIYGGTPLPVITWTKNGSRILWSDRISQAHYGKSLAIKNVTFEDAGTYTCEASNGVGTAQSHSVNLDVLATPYFTVEPESANRAEDETVTFRCEANGKPEPDLKWTHNGRPISETLANDRRVVGSNTITISRLSKTDTSNYGCNATNSLGYVYKDFYLNVVNVPPEIVDDAPQYQATVDGRTATLTCRLFGVPKPEVKWMRNGMDLIGGRYKVLESGDLQITDVSFADLGEYTCFASNKFGSKDANVQLIVKEHIRITNGPHDQEVAPDNTITFLCNAIADSTLTLEVEWFKDGSPIGTSTKWRYVQNNDHSLTISKTSLHDSGNFTCVAKTELDEASSSAELVVRVVPDSPALNVLVFFTKVFTPLGGF